MLAVPLLPNYLSSALLYLDQCQDIIHPQSHVIGHCTCTKSSLILAWCRSWVPLGTAAPLAGTAWIRLGLRAPSFAAPALGSVLWASVRHSHVLCARTGHRVGCLASATAAQGMLSCGSFHRDPVAGAHSSLTGQPSWWALAVSLLSVLAARDSNGASCAWHGCRGDSWRCTRVHRAFQLCHREWQSSRCIWGVTQQARPKIHS